MNWVDIIILLVITIFIAVGFWKGFIFSVISLFGTFVNAVIALVLTKPVSTLLNNWFGLEKSLEQSLSSKILKMHDGFSTNLISMSDSDIKSHINNTLNESDFPMNKLFTRLINVKGKNISQKSELTLNDILSESLSKFFTLIISFLIIFVLIYIILLIISLVTKKLKEIESIRITDRILGVLFGVIKGTITIIFVIGFISLFKEDGLLENVISYIKDSPIGGFAYNHINTFVDKYLTLDNVVKTIK